MTRRAGETGQSISDRDRLVGYAHEAGRRQNWMEAYAFWNELDRAEPLDSCRVMALENARLAGILPVVGLSNRDTPAAIIAVLSPAYAQDLLAEVIRRGPPLSEGDLRSIEHGYDRVPEVVRRSLIHAALRDHDMERLEYLEAIPVTIRPISSAHVRESVTLFSEAEALLPDLRLQFADVPVESGEISAVFRETRILRLERAVVTSESDAVEIGGQWFFDAVSYPHSRILDTTNDPIVLGLSSAEVAIPTRPPESRSFSGGLWLAYPLTHAWGHFMLECLTRLAIFHAAAERRAENVIVSSMVPESFLGFARYLYPWARFSRLDPGASVLVDECWVIPSRELTPGRSRWSADGNKYPNMDPQSLSLLGAHMRESLERHDETAPMYPKRVYLDRTSATNRKSDSETSVRAIAESHGFHIVDPGTLSPSQEINLFVNAVDVAGFSGSQILLTVAMANPGRQLYFYHDESAEMRAINYSLEVCTGTTPSWILGSRTRFVPGYSEQSIHQQIMLSEDALSAARDWFAAIE